MHEHIDEFMNILRYYADNKEFFFTGSRVVCDPPILDTDIDVVVMYNGAFSGALQSAGYAITPHAEYPNANLSACYRKGSFNIIACGDTATFNKWRKATELAKLMNLQEKQQRVLLFQFITEGQVRDTAIAY